MKLLIDSCTGLRLARALAQHGCDVSFVGDWDGDPGDSEIIKIAKEQGRVIVTRDKDFGALAVLHRVEHSGIVRLVALPPLRELPLCIKVLSEHREELARGALITVELHRIRIREP